MTDNTEFFVGRASISLSQNQLTQLVEASTPIDAYKMGEGLWARICDLFCIGSDRRLIKKLFYEINQAPEDILPSIQLSRFKELSKHANPHSIGTFIIDVKGDPTGSTLSDLWSYELTIQNMVIYKSPQFRGYGFIRRELCLEEAVWNSLQAIERLNMQGDFLEQYVESKIESLSDFERLSNLKMAMSDGTDRLYLREIIDDPFYCSKNFSGVKVSPDDDSLFLVDFKGANGRSERLFLCNRNSTNMEYRAEIAQNAFKSHEWKNLFELLSRDYGTRNDTMMRGLVNANFSILKAKTCDEFIYDPDVLRRLKEEFTARNGYPPVALLEFLSIELAPHQKSSLSIHKDRISFHG